MDVFSKIKKAYIEMYHNADIGLVSKAFADIVNLFNGNIEGFQRCDAVYHDITHTMQTVPPFLDMIMGWNIKEGKPEISKTYLDIGLIAVLLHDTGYIKTVDDIEGTGAKYTFQHIQRSINFASHYLSDIGFDSSKINSVANAIRCTGMKFQIDEIVFSNSEEKIIGFALGTADLLGQMAAIDYTKRLTVLYKEFEEAYKYEGYDKLRKEGVKLFSSEEDLIKSTKYFYEYIVLDRFKKMNSLYQYIPNSNNQYKNLYIEAIEKNIIKLENILKRN